MSTQRNSTTDKRQKNQYCLAFAEESRGAAPMASVEGTESELAKRTAESPVTKQWMEEVCGNCETPSVLRSLEEWTRRRLRSAIWKQWKRGRTRFTELRKRGVGQDLAARAAGSAHGPWQLANSPALAIALPNAYFHSLGIPTLNWVPVAQPTESPYTDPYVR